MSDDLFPPAQPTSGLWASMMGLGPIMKLINDPGLADNARKAIQAIIEGQARIARIEEKLDQLLAERGHVAGAGRSPIAALPTRLSNGAGTDAASSVAADDGSGGAAAASDAVGEVPGRDGASGHALLAAGRHRGSA